MFTIDYIEKTTGLSDSFIRKCLKNLDTILKPHYNKGEFNQIQFTQNGYVIFDQIKQMKAQGLNIVAIKKHLENQLAGTQTYPNTTKTSNINIVEHPLNHLSADMNLFNKLFEEKEARLKERAEHQQRIMELEHLSDHLKGQLLYLTDGRTPEECKKAWYQEEMDKQRISWLIREIENLEGIFSVVNYFKRKKLYKELQGLMTKQNTQSSNNASNAT
jgi:DNA-binding transcriptional MerR regulator